VAEARAAVDDQRIVERQERRARKEVEDAAAAAYAASLDVISDDEGNRVAAMEEGGDSDVELVAGNDIEEWTPDVWDMLWGKSCVLGLSKQFPWAELTSTGAFCKICKDHIGMHPWGGGYQRCVGKSTLHVRTSPRRLWLGMQGARRENRTSTRKPWPQRRPNKLASLPRSSQLPRTWRTITT